MTDTEFTNSTPGKSSEVNKALWMRRYIGDTTEQLQLGVTATSGSVSFAATTYGIAIRNHGSHQIYINFDATATTSGQMLDPGEVKEFYIDGGIDAVHAICDSGDTSDMRVWGFR